ncbi:MULTISPECIES: thiolase family protein [unclassified Beijerinckia]|uniref:thiolase family protein n=1 Tax=unclassified Beijerinckia TaxID=2638183 RepID=UPI000896C4BD|nr:MULTISPECIES: thiolase family protein [unclassified Beijerinckia]MDH7797917.1 acetyl-CoA C-acetyltransferase [Beijerinckia sp. GAS462]SED02799.1 acetyl-CoA C-acetyltransferase [Beijerinckia sp. 28-YEA-48]
MTGARTAWIVAAKRTAVAPRHGAFAALGVHDLAAPLIGAILEETGIAPDSVDEIILGNALYGGGNPARVVGLAAGLPQRVPAQTIDTQCCAGLDAIIAASERILAGTADVILCGGVESFSRSPLRLRRPLRDDEEAVEYQRPPFTPWADRDPDMIASAHDLAVRLDISRSRQEAFAIESHAKTLAARAHLHREIVPVAGLDHDAFGRRLSEKTCARLPALAGAGAHALTAATIAVEADAAAVLAVVSDAALKKLKGASAVRIVAAKRVAGDPVLPGLMSTEAAKAVLAQVQTTADAISAVEIMEAFAAQALGTVDALRFDSSRINRGGGALSRGHPIGASGGILAVRLFHELQREEAGARGLATIAAAGGLGSALIVEKA